EMQEKIALPAIGACSVRRWKWREGKRYLEYRNTSQAEGYEHDSGRAGKKKRGRGDQTVCRGTRGGFRGAIRGCYGQHPVGEQRGKEELQAERGRPSGYHEPARGAGGCTRRFRLFRHGGGHVAPPGNGQAGVQRGTAEPGYRKAGS